MDWTRPAKHFCFIQKPNPLHVPTAWGQEASPQQLVCMMSPSSRFVVAGNKSIILRVCRARDTSVPQSTSCQSPLYSSQLSLVFPWPLAAAPCSRGWYPDSFLKVSGFPLLLESPDLDSWTCCPPGSCRWWQHLISRTSPAIYQLATPWGHPVWPCTTYPVC